MRECGVGLVFGLVFGFGFGLWTGCGGGAYFAAAEAADGDDHFGRYGGLSSRFGGVTSRRGFVVYL